MSKIEYAERGEKYNGGGINIKYTVNDRLKVMFDYAASQTERVETIIQTRLQSENRDIYQNNVEGAKKFTGLVNLVIDKTLKYNYVKTIMRTCAEAGYSKYKFIVRGVEE